MPFHLTVSAIREAIAQQAALVEQQTQIARETKEMEELDAVVGFDNGMSESFVHRRIISALGGFATGGPAGAALGFVGGGRSGGVSSKKDRARQLAGSSRPTAIVAPFREADPCPGLFSVQGPGGTCINIADVAPFGDPFVTEQPEIGGPGGQAVAVIGSFGMPAMVPDVVGQVMDANGNVNPIRRCRAGVLGKDNLCYLKIPNSFRKWPRAARPPVSASDAKCIRRAASATKRVERLAKSVGLRTKKR